MEWSSIDRVLRRPRGGTGVWTIPGRPFRGAGGGFTKRDERSMLERNISVVSAYTKKEQVTRPFTHSYWEPMPAILPEVSQNHREQPLR